MLIYIRLNERQTERKRRKQQTHTVAEKRKIEQQQPQRQQKKKLFGVSVLRSDWLYVILISVQFNDA